MIQKRNNIDLIAFKLFFVTPYPDITTTKAKNKKNEIHLHIKRLNDQKTSTANDRNTRRVQLPLSPL